MGTQVDIGSIRDKLIRERDHLLERVKELDVKIAFTNEMEAMGGNGMKPVTRSEPSSSESSLPGMMIQILQDQEGWLSAKEIHDEAFRRGYETTSKKSRILVASTLSKMEKRGRVAKKSEGRNVKFATVEYAKKGDY